MELKPLQITKLKRLLRNLLTDTLTPPDKSVAIDLIVLIQGGKIRYTGNQTVDDLTDDQYNSVVEEIVNNRKIQAIKLLREYSGLGLKDAKDVVENPAYFR